MVRRETFEAHRERLAHGPRREAIQELMRGLIDDQQVGDDASYALAMLIVDAVLEGDELSLHSAVRQLQVAYRTVSQRVETDTAIAEDRGRILAFLDLSTWGLERALALEALAEVEQDSSAHTFLKAISEKPGMTNGELAQLLGISQAEASRAGRRLSDVGLAGKRRLGRQNHWEVTPKGIQTLELLEAGGVGRFLRPHYQRH
jgi:DNA-binding MarR family transcriptional regulator